MTLEQITALIGAAVSLLCTVTLGALTYFAKKTLTDFAAADKRNSDAIEKAAQRNAEAMDKLDRRHTEALKALETKQERSMEKLAGDLNDLKADLPLVYTLREDFIRSMNGVDRSIGTLDQKMDKVISIVTSNSKKEG